MINLVWIICDMIIYGIEAVIIGIIMIGIIGMMEGGQYKNPKLKKVYDVLFSIDEEA